MDLAKAARWNPPESWGEVTVVDSHAAGEPFRLVIDGLPEIPGDTVLERRRYAQEELDWLRRALMWEPRGHADMYGGWIGSPVRDDSDLAVLFLHNQGFSTMCGHGIIALTTIVCETGIFESDGEAKSLKIDTPAGQIVSTATIEDGSVRSVTFQNVPSFADSLDNIVGVEGYGEIAYDLAFGGAYYAYVDARATGIDWPPNDQSQLVRVGRAIKQAVSDSHQITHPDDPELGFLYGVIFSGPPIDGANNYRNVCVFADGEVDRSPTGTGVSGRLAIDAARGLIAPGESLTIESIIGTQFSVTYQARAQVGAYPAVIPEVSGSAHITGRSTMWIDPNDSAGGGFLLQ